MNAEVINQGEWTRPVPAPDSVSQPYFEACERGELLIQKCPSCGNRQHYPRAWCIVCGATPEWLTATGTGTVYTYTIVRQFGQEPFRENLPYIVAMIELAEGPKLMGNITDCNVEDVHIDMPVQVYMVEAAPGIAVPFWRPAQ